MKQAEIKQDLEYILGTVKVEEIVINDKFRFVVEAVMVGNYYLDYYFEGKAENIELEVIEEVQIEGTTLKVWTC